MKMWLRSLIEEKKGNLTQIRFLGLEKLSIELIRNNVVNTLASDSEIRSLADREVAKQVKQLSRK